MSTAPSVGRRIFEGGLLKLKYLLPGALALVAMSASPFAFAADHLDAPGVMMTGGDPSIDITDVYTWNDGSNVVLIMDVFPLATTSSKFSNTIKYAFHTESTAKYGMAGTAKDVVCTFDATQKISCWVTTPGAATADDYVTGDASATLGIKSASGKITVHTGLHDDPFFFNLQGFKDAVADVDAAETASALTFDPAGCPNTAGAVSAKLVNDVTHTSTNTPTMAPQDFFAGKNVLAIVMTVDKSLLTTGGPLVAVWGSTNQ